MFIKMGTINKDCRVRVQMTSLHGTPTHGIYGCTCEADFKYLGSQTLLLWTESDKGTFKVNPIGKDFRAGYPQLC